MQKSVIIGIRWPVTFSLLHERSGSGNSETMRRRRCAGLLALLFYAFASFSLPVRLTPELFLSRRAPVLPGAMTVGCSEASCCTSRCYLDEDGVHHCVPAAGKSCGCGLSSGEIPAGTLATGDEVLIPVSERPMRDQSSTLFACEILPGPRSVLLLPPTPPPRS